VSNHVRRQKVLQAAIAVSNYVGAQTSSTATLSQQEVDDVASTEPRISEPSMYLNMLLCILCFAGSLQSVANKFSWYI